LIRKPILLAFLLLGALQPTELFAQKAQLIPHAQDRPPNEAKTPQEAAKAMTVPPGFTVEVVASEPMLVNPVAMTIDEKGRFWITESLEYPRREPGKGRDRVKVLEDTDGDGTVDKSTIFAEGLNIPSGIAVGGGGVWVANAPDILFLQDTDGDGKADKTEVVVTGFGRDDTHELPNSLTWGPDGWLYGLNGVFNRSVVKYRGKTYDFTAALFRIHPKTRDFELFCEGTSNPWGVAFNQDGEAFISACVIDHLWHLTEQGYYHRQGGPYPQHTWKIESIVDYKHQKAAYCGIQYFDSDAYPVEYRDQLMMGNIHGGCINVDALTRNGSTYKGIKKPDFLTANDAWFMPVVQKIGPDGCLYILDWYDRYHCYQDANRDPAGIDRLKGRLYRVRYKDTPRAKSFDLSKETDEQLIERLGSPNLYYRDLAQRLLRERANPATLGKLDTLILDKATPRKARMHGLWARVGAGNVPSEVLLGLLDDSDPGFRAWGVRASGEKHEVDDQLRRKLISMTGDRSADVRLQLAIAATKVKGLAPSTLLPEILKSSSDDLLIRKIVWRAYQTHINGSPRRWVAPVLSADLAKADYNALADLTPRMIEVLADASHADSVKALSDVLNKLQGSRPAEFRKALETVGAAVEDGAFKGKRLDALRAALEPIIAKVGDDQNDKSFALTTAMLGHSIQLENSIDRIKAFANDQGLSDEARNSAKRVLIESGDLSILDGLIEVLRTHKGSPDSRIKTLALVAEFDSPKTAPALIEAYSKAEPNLTGRFIEVMSQRPRWARELVAAVKANKIPKDAVNITQVRRLTTIRDKDIATAAKSIWGTVRENRNPQRELTISMMRTLFNSSTGDPKAGAVVFKNLCAQCHKIYGEGQEVGPEITSNGRGSFEQMLSNVFDPSLVIGEAFQATSVATTDGRVLTGLQVENSLQRIVLKTQGGKTEIIPRDKVDEVKVSSLSLMPEDLEKQLKPQELVDLFSFLALDKPTTDSSAKPIPGTPATLIKK
jgi:putative membrane-bound dehydrogenase-like protein